MACAEPLPAWQAIKGGEVYFAPPKNGHLHRKMELPCGTCILCRQEQARQWAVRITHEAQQHDVSTFLTLTYDDKHLPEHNSLHYPDLQRFWKRLRKKYGKLRYYAVGEYGDNTQRPHYHACLFGHAFTEDRVIIKEEPRLWVSEELNEAWGLGRVTVGALTYESAQYTASYVTKKLRAKQQYVRVDEATGELVPLVQPRAFMSLRPAVGRDWIDQYSKQTYARDFVVINGKRQKPPKYYDRRLEAENTAKYEKIKEVRRKAPKPSLEQTRARARNAHAHAEAKRRSKSV